MITELWSIFLVVGEHYSIVQSEYSCFFESSQRKQGMNMNFIKYRRSLAAGSNGDGEIIRQSAKAHFTEAGEP